MDAGQDLAKEPGRLQTDWYGDHDRHHYFEPGLTLTRPRALRCRGSVQQESATNPKPRPTGTGNPLCSRMPELGQASPYRPLGATSSYPYGGLLRSSGYDERCPVCAMPGASDEGGSAGTLIPNPLARAQGPAEALATFSRLAVNPRQLLHRYAGRDRRCAAPQGTC